MVGRLLSERPSKAASDDLLTDSAHASGSYGNDPISVRTWPGDQSDLQYQAVFRAIRTCRFRWSSSYRCAGEAHRGCIRLPSCRYRRAGRVVRMRHRPDPCRVHSPKETTVPGSVTVPQSQTISAPFEWTIRLGVLVTRMPPTYTVFAVVISMCRCPNDDRQSRGSQSA